MKEEGLSYRGEVDFILKDSSGKIKKKFTKKNLVVNTGLALGVARLIGVVSDALSHVALGTSTTAASNSQTGLITEIARVASSIATITTTSANDTIEFTTTFPAGTATGALTEAGLFNASSAGVMFSRIVFSVTNKAAGDELVVVWRIIGGR